MALCILTMLFIGVHMVSTINPKYLTLFEIHKTLGIVILLLALIRLGVRLRSGAPPLPRDLPAPMKLAAHLSHYALYALMIALPLIGWAMLSAAGYPVVLWGGFWLPPIAPQSDGLHTLLVDRACFARAAVFRGDPPACRRGAVSRAGAARRRVRGDGVAGDGLCRGRGRAPAGGIAARGVACACAEHRRQRSRSLPGIRSGRFAVRHKVARKSLEMGATGRAAIFGSDDGESCPSAINIPTRLEAETPRMRVWDRGDPVCALVLRRHSFCTR